MRQILELFNKKFKAAIINMFQGEITNARLKQIKKQKVSANEKKKKPWRRNRKYKEGPNGSFRTEKYNNQKQKQKLKLK